MIKEIVNSIASTGVLKSSQYLFKLDFPAFLINEFAGQYKIDERFVSRIERVSLPADNTTVEEYPSQSQNTLVISSDRDKPDYLSFSIILSEDMREREYFEVWQEFIYGKEDFSFQPKFRDLYLSPRATIEILNRRDQLIKSYIFKDLFPITISETEFSYGSTDEYATVTITMAYSSWYRERPRFAPTRL